MSQKPNKQNLSANWLLPTIKYGLFACLFMPLIVSGDFIFPYIFPKQAFFQIIVEILLALYIFLAFKDPRYRPSRFSWLFKAILAYLVVMILSAIFGENTYHSFWSNFERMAGVIAYWHYFAYLFIAVCVFRNKEDWHSFFNFSIIASVLEAFYAVGQLLQGGAGSRVFGTIGNPSFLAGYMLINALFALWLFLEKKDFGWRVFYGFTIVLNLFILYETQTRGAMLALGIGLIVLALFALFAPASALTQWPLKKPARLKTYAAVLLIFIFLAAAFIWGFRHAPWLEKFPTLARLAHMSFEEATSKTRLLAWQMSLEGFREYPIFGWGTENYSILFNKYYDPDLYPVESWFDRSHNAYLDVLVNTGLVGLAAYGAIFVLAFGVLWRNWREQKTNYFTLAIFSVILIAYGVQNIFLFDTQVALLMIFSIWAFLVFLSRPSLVAPQKLTSSIRPNYFFVALIAALTLFVVYAVNLKPGLASVKGIKALRFIQQNDFKSTVGQFKEAYQIGTFGLPEVAMRANDLALQILNNTQVKSEIKKEIVSLAAEGMKKSLELEPLNARFMMILGTTYLAAAQIDPVYLSKADFILNRALELSPTRQELYFALGQLKMFQGKNAEVLPAFKKAVELNDKVAVSHWNYGLMAIVLGQVDLGEKEINQAIDLGRGQEAGDMEKLINAYAKNNKWAKVIYWYQKWIELTPDNARPYAGLAAAYAQTGDKQKAKEYALRAAEIDSSYRPETEQFIKSLGL